MDRQDGSLVCEIVRDKKRLGFLVVDVKGKEHSMVFDSLDFARAAMLQYASEVMWQVANEAYDNGEQSQLGMVVQNDKVYFSLEATTIKSI